MPQVRMRRQSNSFAKHLAMDARFPLAHFVLGLTFKRKGRFDEAIAEFKQALDDRWT